MTRRAETENWEFSGGSTKTVTTLRNLLISLSAITCLSNKNIISAWECFEMQMYLWIGKGFENSLFLKKSTLLLVYYQTLEEFFQEYRCLSR